MPGKMHLIERQLVLENQDQVNDDGHEQVRRQHMEGIGPPIHRPASRTSPDQKIDRRVDRIEERVQSRLPVQDDIRQIAANWNAEHKNAQQNGTNLYPGMDHRRPR